MQSRHKGITLSIHSFEYFFKILFLYFSRLKIAGYSVTTSWFLILCSRYIHAHASFTAKWRRIHMLMRRLPPNGAVQTNQMKATPAIYVPTLYDYNSHLIGCHQRHSELGDKVWLARRAGLIIPPRRDLV